MFYTLSLLYAMTVLQIFKPVYFDNPYSAYNKYFMNICYGWTIIIIIDDLLKHQFEYKSAQLALLVFIISSICSAAFSGGQIKMNDFYTIAGFSMKLYVFFSMALHYTQEEMDRLFVRISKQIVVVVLIVNFLSSIIYFMYRFNLPIAIGSIHDHNRFISYRFPDMIPHNSFGNARFQGLYIYSQIAGFMCYTSMVLAAYLYRMHQISVHLTVTSGLLSLIITFVANSRVSLICEMIVILYAFWLTVSKHINKNKALLMIVLITCAFLMVIVNKIPEIQTLIKLFGSNESGINAFTSNRLLMWKTAINEALKKPLLGAGWSHGSQLYSLIGFYNCHNIFINLFYYGGTLGLVSYSIFLIISIRKICQQWRQIKGEKKRLACNYGYVPVYTGADGDCSAI